MIVNKADMLLDILEDIGELIFGDKRLDALRHFAKQEGFDIRRKVSTALLPKEVRRLELFDGVKDSQVIKGLLFKMETSPAVRGQIMDFKSAGGSKTTTLYLIESSKLDLPHMILRPRSSFSRLNVFGSNEWADIDKFFATNFTVESEDMNAMRMLITIQFAEVANELSGYTIEGIGDFLAIYKKGYQDDIIHMDNKYDSAIRLADIILHDHSNEFV